VLGNLDPPRYLRISSCGNRVTSVTITRTGVVGSRPGRHRYGERPAGSSGSAPGPFNSETGIALFSGQAEDQPQVADLAISLQHIRYDNQLLG